MKKSNYKNQLYFLLALLFIYVTLFEFILPINRVLPKPSILLESFLHVWKYYNLLEAIVFSAGFVYSSITFGYIIIYLSRKYLANLLLKNSAAFNLLGIFRYVPAFFYAVLFVFWFKQSYLAEFVFATISFLFLFTQKLYQEINLVGEEYIYSAKSLFKGKNTEQIYWQCALPNTFNYLKRIHYYLWTLVLIYEFVNNSIGIGSVYRLALEYYDFGGIFVLAIFISILILLGSKLIDFVKTKLAFWEA